MKIYPRLLPLLLLAANLDVALVEFAGQLARLLPADQLDD